MSSIDELAQIFRKFPGIGERQAKRFVYFLLKARPEYVNQLITEIQKTRSNTKICQESYQFFIADNQNSNTSFIARDPNRDKTKLLIVEKDTDLQNIEKMKVYNGNYFVIGGSLPYLAENPEQLIRINELRAIVEMKIKRDSLSEIIFALSATPQGEHTEEYVKNKLETLTKNNDLKVSHLGRGLSTGLEIEYSDKDTFEQAFRHRSDI
ncbi:recombination protein RecR [Candidatus Parcubacteria bacterium]|nr:recombination protein RecR [Candidatus Parcubacteria bacterium]